MYGYVGLCIGMYGYVWLGRAMYGYVWLCMAMEGCVGLCTLFLVTNGEPLYDAYTTYLPKNTEAGFQIKQAPGQLVNFRYKFINFLSLSPLEPPPPKKNIKHKKQ